MVCRGLPDDLVEVFAVGVGDENLAEDVACHQLHDALYAGGVELVEEVVEQKYGGCGAMLGKELILCQFERYKVSFALSLRADSLHGIVVERHLHVVAVYASGGVSDEDVTAACRGQLWQQVALGEVSAVGKS